jgi:Lar family restriction alleviation protein
MGDSDRVTQAREALDMDTLKPCPFCGFEARIIEVEETDNRGGFVVCCTGCEASTKVWFPIKDDVTQILRDEWNKRAAALSDAQQQEIERLKAATTAEYDRMTSCGFAMYGPPALCTCGQCDDEKDEP